MNKIVIDKNKYLYWLDENNPELEQEKVYREMYSRIGHILHIVQMIEYNIANILSLEEFEKINGKLVREDDIQQVKKNIDIKYKKLTKKTFGKLGKEIKKSSYLSNLNLEALEKIIVYRNYIVHSCFKEKLLKNELSLNDIDDFMDELNDYELIIMSLNEALLDVFKKHKVKQVITLKK